MDQVSLRLLPGPVLLFWALDHERAAQPWEKGQQHWSDEGLFALLRTGAVFLPNQKHRHPSLSNGDTLLEILCYVVLSLCIKNHKGNSHRPTQANYFPFLMQCADEVNTGV